MNELFKNILIASVVCFLTIMVYHRLHQHEITIVEENFAHKVSMYEKRVAARTNYRKGLEDSDIFIEAANYAKSSVVSIKAVQVKGNSIRKDKYTRSSGSGVVIDPDGYIVTNYHVIEDADIIECITEDKREYEAELVGYDVSTDLALLKVESHSMDYLQFGDSDDLKIGEWVLAVGNPFKLSASVTAGIVSAKARNINIFNRQGIESFIQTDAAINPGNSGGALINTDGYLVGINTAILTYSGKYEGFSFAIPSSIVEKVVKDIRQYGAVQRAWLGVGVQEVSFEQAKSLKLDFVGGAMIDFIENESAAKKSGLQVGDVIVNINGKSTNAVPRFLESISQYRPGDTITIDYYRSGKMHSCTSVLQNQLNTTDFIPVRKDKVLRDLGIELRELDSSEKTRLNTQGVMVVSIYRGSTIDKTNMDPNYIITSINDKAIRSVDDLIGFLDGFEGRVFIKGFYENWPGDYPYVFDYSDQ